MKDKEVVVIKIGSKVLVSELGKIRLKVLRSLAKQISKVHQSGGIPLIVTSGAIACGNSLAWAKTVIDKQVAASIGQRKLMSHWGQAFDDHGLEVSQILCTHLDLRHKTVLAVLRRTLKLRIIPIINENDSVADEEIRALKEHGDNDALAVGVAIGVKADRLIMLTDVDGFFADNPKTNPGLLPIPVVSVIDDEIKAMAQRIDSDRPTGMGLKIDAADKAMKAGITAHIANGDRPNVICDILSGQQIGTMFPASPGL